MASGDTLASILPQQNEPPAADHATPDTRNAQPVLDFALNEIAVFKAYLPGHYAGGGFTCDIEYGMSSAIADDIKLEGSIERGEVGVRDVDSDSFAAAQDGGDQTVPGDNTKTKKYTITFTNDQIDGLVKNEWYRLKLKRVAVAGTDAAGDLEFRGLVNKET